jgi:hypothetical protein
MDSEQTINAAVKVVDAVSANGGQVRLLGGVAVAVRCPSARNDGPLARSYSDMDLVTTQKYGPILTRVLRDLGYVPADSFNALHGRKRLIFDDPHGLHVDVFLDEFEMCHRLDLRKSVEREAITLSLAELLLTKLQVAELNEKDVSDTAALFVDHELGSGENDIDSEFVTTVLSEDWGWWRTVSHNLLAIPDHLSALPLSEHQVNQVRRQANKLVSIVDEAPKGVRWRMRAKVGDRAVWREEPEERG